MTPNKCTICQYQPCPPNRSVCYSCIPIDAVAERAQARLDAVTAERDRLQREVERLNAKLNFTYCAFCGHEERLDDQTATKIAAHIMECPKHPLRDVELALEQVVAERDRLREEAEATPLKLEICQQSLSAARSELRRMAKWCPECNGVGHAHKIDLDGNITEHYPDQPCEFCGPARRLLANHEGRTA